MGLESSQTDPISSPSRQATVRPARCAKASALSAAPGSRQSVELVLRLQRTAGNVAVARLVRSVSCLRAERPNHRQLQRAITRAGPVFGRFSNQLFWARAIDWQGQLRYQIGDSQNGPWYPGLVAPDTTEFADANIPVAAEPEAPHLWPTPPLPQLPSRSDAPPPLPLVEHGPPGVAVESVRLHRPPAPLSEQFAASPSPLGVQAPWPPLVQPLAPNASPLPLPSPASQGIGVEAFREIKIRSQAIEAIDQEARDGRLDHARALIADWNSRKGRFQQIGEDDVVLAPTTALTAARVDVAAVWTETRELNSRHNAEAHFGKHGPELGHSTLEAYVEAAIELKRTAKYGYTQQSQGTKTHYITLDSATLKNDPQQWRGEIVIVDDRGKIASYYLLNHASAVKHGYGGVAEQLYYLEHGLVMPTDSRIRQGYIDRLRQSH